MVSHIVSDTAEIRHIPAAEGGDDCCFVEPQQIVKCFGPRIYQGGKYQLTCFSAVNNADSLSLLKVASANVSIATVSKLATWARLETISYQHLLLLWKTLSRMV